MRKGVIYPSIFIILLALIAISRTYILPKTVQAADAYLDYSFPYEYKDQTLTYYVTGIATTVNPGTVTVYNNTDNQNLTGEVTIPATVNYNNKTFNVTAIYSNAFNNCSKISSISIPAGVTSIGIYAFSGCNSLTNISIPTGVRSIGGQAFSDCCNLAGIKIPEGVKSIGSRAFYNCIKLTRLELPEGITTIGDEAFGGCSGLKSVSLPEGIKSIGSSMFENCSSLKSISIPKGITSIGNRTFMCCSSLTDVSIPEGVTGIGYETFKNCNSLTDINIPESVTDIGGHAFYNCGSLKGLNLPEALRSIGDYAFYNCGNLNGIKIPAGVTSIGHNAFILNSNLKYVYKNSYAEDFFIKYWPDYYQIIKLPLEEMTFRENVKNIGAGETVSLKPDFYPAHSSDITDNIVWSSSNPYIAYVNSNGEITGLNEGEAVITAVMGDYSAACHIYVGGDIINPTAMEFTKSSMEMNKGESTRLQLTFAPAAVTNKSITWTSSNPSVITVDNGRIYAKKPGVATVTAASSTCLATCEVKVYSPMKGIYPYYQGILYKGESKKISIYYFPMDTTDDTTVVWSSSDEAVVTVENGVITAVGAGTASIIARIGTFTQNIPVTVQVPIKSILFQEAKIIGIPGQSYQLPINFQPLDTTDTITFSSSDEKVATVIGGAVNTLSAGVTKITATNGILSASCFIIVDGLNKESMNLNSGDSETLTLTYNPDDIDNNQTVIWTSSDDTVATVDSNGKVTAVRAGKADITAVLGSYTANCEVNVSVPIREILLNKTSLNLNTGESETLSVTYNPENTTVNKEVTWSSSDGAVATVDSNGKVTILGVGTATITAATLDNSQRVSCAVSAIPPAPAVFKAEMNGYNSARISWGTVKGANGYRVYRALSQAGTYSLITTTTSTSFTDTGLTTGSTYYYKVRAFRYAVSYKVYSSEGFTDIIHEKVYGSYTEAISITPVLSTPDNTKVTAINYSGAVVSWSLVKGASGYRVYRATSKAGTYTRIATTASTSYTDTGLTTGKTYYYKVRAYCNVGSEKVYSSYTEVKSVTPIPSAPTSFKAAKVSSASIKVSWSKVSGASGYRIYRSTSIAGIYSYIKGTTASYYTNYGLTKGKTYYFKVRAYRLVGTTKVYSKYTNIVAVKI